MSADFKILTRYSGSCGGFAGGPYSVRRARPQIEGSRSLSWLETPAQSGGFAGSDPVGPTVPLKGARRNSKKMLGITRSTRGSCTTRPEMIATARGCCIAMRAVLGRYLTLVVVGVIVLLVAGVTWSRGGQTVMRDCLENRSGSVGEPKVRILLPPAESPLRT